MSAGVKSKQVAPRVAEPNGDRVARLGRRAPSRSLASMPATNSEGAAVAADRVSVIDAICSGFVSPSRANREIYRVILTTLWPAGSDLPGPVIGRQALRDSVDAYRASVGKPAYMDVFRRVRELQGEEGILGLQKVAGGYRLLDSVVSEKRVPRSAVNSRVWETTLFAHNHQCAVCGQHGGAESGPSLLVPDHKIPRSRLNEPRYREIEADGVTNIQPLCVNCNTEKSVSCRGCSLDCSTCPWANPETYRPVMLRGVHLVRLSEVADSLNVSSQELLESLVESRHNELAGTQGLFESEQ